MDRPFDGPLHGACVGGLQQQEQQRPQRQLLHQDRGRLRVRDGGPRRHGRRSLRRRRGQGRRKGVHRHHRRQGKRGERQPHRERGGPEDHQERGSVHPDPGVRRVPHEPEPVHPGRGRVRGSVQHQRQQLQQEPHAVRGRDRPGAGGAAGRLLRPGVRAGERDL